MPGMFAEIEFDGTLLARAADGRVDPIFSPVKIENRALAVSAGLGDEIIANCFGAALNFGWA